MSRQPLAPAPLAGFPPSGPRSLRNIDLALTRLLAVGSGRTLELRLEAFNLTNHFNWGLPQTNLLAASFGRITSQANPPRILQFGVKYGF